MSWESWEVEENGRTGELSTEWGRRGEVRHVGDVSLKISSRETLQAKTLKI